MSNEITLPNFEIKPCSWSCPRCGGEMVTVKDSTRVFNSRGLFIIHNAPLFKCSKCSWDGPTHETYERIDEILESYPEIYTREEASLLSIKMWLNELGAEGIKDEDNTRV